MNLNPSAIAVRERARWSLRFHSATTTLIRRAPRQLVSCSLENLLAIVWNTLGSLAGSSTA